MLYDKRNTREKIRIRQTDKRKRRELTHQDNKTITFL
jgi:hypothetical protein